MIEELIFDNIGSFINKQETSEAEFNNLALLLFEYQYTHNKHYQNFCNRLGYNPDNVTNWEQIPAIPTECFRYFYFSCFPSNRIVTTGTSGGTTHKIRAWHYFDKHDLHLQEEIIQTIAKEHLLPYVNDDRIRILALESSPELSPNYDSYCIDFLLRKYGTDDSKFLWQENGFDMKYLINTLQRAEKRGEPLLIVGTNTAHLNVIHNLKESGSRFDLPKGSLFVTYGGFYGEREVDENYFISQLQKIFGLSRKNWGDAFAMTELSSPYVHNPLKGNCNKKLGYKENNPWERARVVDTHTLGRLPKGSIGLIEHYDLTNSNSAIALLSDDLGYETERGFEFVGRAKDITQRVGYLSQVEEMLKANT